MVHSLFTQPTTSRSALHPAGRSFCPELIDKDVAPFDVRRSCWLGPMKPARWVTEVGRNCLQSSIASSSTTWAPEYNSTRGISYYTPGVASASFDYSSAPLYASSLDLGASEATSQAVGPPATSFLDPASESDILRLINPPVLTKLLSPSTSSVSTKLNQRDGNQLRYPCDFCPVRMARLHDINRHMRLHTNEKPYECLGCGQAFRRSDTRVRHWAKSDACLRAHRGKEPGWSRSRRRISSRLYV